MNQSIGYLYFSKTLGWSFETGLDIFTTTISNNQLILEVTSTAISNRYIRVLISNGKLKLKISLSSGDTYEYLTNLSLELNTWQSLKLSMSEIEYYDDYYSYIYISLGDIGVGYEVTDSCFSDSKVYVGSKLGYTKYKGLMKDFYIVPNSTNVTPNLYSIYKIKAINDYNKFNLLSSHNITVNDKTYYKKDFTYYSDKMLVQYETFTINNVNYSREYTYYPNGNIQTITDNTFGSKSYIYDYLGRLEDDGNYRYSYNSRGDIMSKGSIIYNYDGFGRLISYGSSSISYTGTSLYPYNYMGKYISYIRNKISGFYNDGSLSSPVVTYTYNEFNLRNTKNVNGNITNYIYDGDSLITEYNNSRRIDYLYDNCDIT